MLALWSNQKSISTPKIEIESKGKGVGTLRSQGCRLSSLPTRWHMVTCLSRDAHVIPGSGHGCPRLLGMSSNWQFHGSALCDRGRSLESIGFGRGRLVWGS